MFRKALLVFAMVALLTPASVSAGVFDLSITSNPGLGGTEQTWSQSFKSISDVIDNLDTAEIKDKLSLYTDTSAANGLINFRGVPINLSIGANSNTIILDIPSIGVTETFAGTDR